MPESKQETMRNAGVRSAVVDADEKKKQLKQDLKRLLVDDFDNRSLFNSSFDRDHIQDSMDHIQNSMDLKRYFKSLAEGPYRNNPAFKKKANFRNETLWELAFRFIDKNQPDGVKGFPPAVLPLNVGKNGGKKINREDGRIDQILEELIQARMPDPERLPPPPPPLANAAFTQNPKCLTLLQWIQLSLKEMRDIISPGPNNMTKDDIREKQHLENKLVTKRYTLTYP